MVTDGIFRRGDKREQVHDPLVGCVGPGEEFDDVCEDFVAIFPGESEGELRGE